MSAEDLGRRLVGEVKVQRLDELLTTLSLLHTPTQPTFNIPPLDNLLSIFTGLPNPTTGITTPNPPIIEITSPTPSQGPLQLLYLITAISILPALYSGKESCICIIDTEAQFSIPRLVPILRQRIKLHDPLVSEDQVVKVVQEALKHIYIFNPQTLTQLISTISSLPEYLLTASHASRQRQVGAVIIPCINSFYWCDRANVDAGVPSQFPALATAIRVCGRRLRAPVVYGSWYLGPAAQNWVLRPQVQVGAGLRVVVRRVRRRFAANVSAEDVLGLQRKVGDGGEEGKEEARFEVRVNGWGAEEWEGRIGDALRREGDGFMIKSFDGGLCVE